MSSGLISKVNSLSVQLQRGGYGSLLEYWKQGHPSQVNSIDLLLE
jgi:hypothetical protein